MKTILLLISGFLLCMPTSSNAAGTLKIIKVSVECSGNDAVGMQLCLALKDRIRKSESFELVDEKTAEISSQGFAVRLVSIDIERTDSPDANLHSAASITFTVPTTRTFDYFVTAYVAVVGGHAVDDEAAEIMGHLDHDSNFLRRASSN